LFFLSHPPPPPDIYTLSLHDALPIYRPASAPGLEAAAGIRAHSDPDRLCLSDRPLRQLLRLPGAGAVHLPALGPARSRVERLRRSEEHTSELQSPYDLVCRLLLEKKK